MAPVPDTAATATTTAGVGVAHLPNQRHKIVAKRGSKFTIMVCGMFLYEMA